MSVKNLKNLLNPSNGGDLGDIVQRARDMGALTETLSSALPDDMAGSILAANVRDNGELVVICPSSAWASRLRFEEELLIGAARRHGEAVETCRVKVSQDHT